MEGSYLVESPVAEKRQPQYRVVQVSREHGQSIHEVVCYANKYPVGTKGCISRNNIEEIIRRFPEGQFVVVTDTPEGEKVVGLALSMRTAYPPSARPLGWLEMIGDLSFSKHDPEGAWLYGVEKAVHPEHQGRGVASALYKAQFALAEQLGLKGMYAGGMLKGYEAYRDRLSVREYAGRVMRGEVFDPTVSMQMRRGFRPCSVIENYAWDQQAEHTGMLIVWERPELASPELVPNSLALTRLPR